MAFRHGSPQKISTPYSVPADQKLLPGVIIRQPISNLGVKPFKSLSSLMCSAIRAENNFCAFFCPSDLVKNKSQKPFIWPSRSLACSTSALVFVRNSLRCSSGSRAWFGLAKFDSPLAFCLVPIASYHCRVEYHVPSEIEDLADFVQVLPYIRRTTRIKRPVRTERNFPSSTIGSTIGYSLQDEVESICM